MRAPYLRINVQHEVITALEDGERALLPPVLGNPVGASLLDIVHPVDRPLVGQWLEEALGVSPPFRRAAADEPPRWFRFVVATAASDDTVAPVLMEEVTEDVRETLLRERLSATLARHTGEELVERSVSVAAELAEANHACLAELHGSLGIVRATYGDMAFAPGTTFRIAGSPLERLSADSRVLEFQDGVQEAFPRWGPFRVMDSRWAVIVPVGRSEGDELVGALVCCSPRPGKLSVVERELLGFLAVRLGAEIGRIHRAEKSAVLTSPVLELPEGFLRMLSLAIAGRGITHTLNNLLGGQLLNAELAASTGGVGTTANVYLERVVMAAQKGGVILRRLSELTGWERGQRAFVPFGPIVGEAVQLVHDLYEASRVSVSGGDCRATVWGDPRLLHAMVLALVAPAVELMGPETAVQLGVTFVEEIGAVRLDLEISGPRAIQGTEEGLEDGFRLGLALATRVAALHGGRLERSGPDLFSGIELTIRASTDGES